MGDQAACRVGWLIFGAKAGTLPKSPRDDKPHFQRLRKAQPCLVGGLNFQWPLPKNRANQLDRFF